MQFPAGSKTMQWWADGQIDDGSFVSGLQWLISNGIMKVTQKRKFQHDN